MLSTVHTFSGCSGELCRSRLIVLRLVLASRRTATPSWQRAAMSQSSMPAVCPALAPAAGKPLENYDCFFDLLAFLANSPAFYVTSILFSLPIWLIGSERFDSVPFSEQERSAACPSQMFVSHFHGVFKYFVPETEQHLQAEQY